MSSTTTTTTTETPRATASTGGPRTPEGKARSAMNAVKHRFSGRTLLIPEDEMEDYTAFLEEWESELDPAGPVESEIFGQIITAAWTLRRLSRAEADLMDESLADPLLLDSAQSKLRLYSIYQSRAERTFHRGIAKLRELQEERILREVILRKDHEPVPLLPRAAIIRREIARDKQTSRKAEIDAIHAMMNAPMPTGRPNAAAAPPRK